MADVSTITASNGTTYNIKDASIAKMWTSTNNTLENKDVIKQYISSRGENLVTNGTALLGNNYNFSTLTYDGSDTYYAGGCFTKTTSSGVSVSCDELIPVDVGQVYEYSYYIKSSSTSAKYYDTIMPYDIDKLAISAYQILYYANTTTTLAQELKNGDTKVYLTSNLANFNTTATAAQGNGAGLIFWNYTNSKGYTYPAETYSRNVYTGLYERDGSGFDTTNNVITLTSAWNKGTIPAGTAVSQEKSGSTYTYLNQNYSLPNTGWKYKTGKIGGGTASNNNNDKRANGILLFREGVAFIKIGFLLNNSSVANVTSKVSTISFGISIPDVNAPLKVYTSVTGTAAVTTSPYYCARYDVTDSSVTGYTNGMMVSIRVPVAGNGSYGTALQINSLGYKPIVHTVNSMISTRYGVGAQIIAVYNSTQTATLYLNSSSASTVTGCWQVCDYDSNDPNYAARTYYGTPKLSSASAYTLYRMQIVLPLLDGTYVPYSNGNNAPTTYTKTINTTNAFNPFGIIYFFTYTSTSTVSAGGNIFDAYLNYQYSNPFDLRYAMNINSSGTAGTTALTAHQPVYIKAKYNYNTHTAVLVPNSSSSNYLEKSSIVQALPSSNPNTTLTDNETYIYIYIGHAHDKYRIGGVYQKTVYNWDAVNNCIQVFDGNRPEPVVFVSQSSTFSEIYEIKQKGKIPIYKDADGYAFPEQVEDSSPSAFTFTKATDAGVIKWYKVDTADAWTSGTKDTIELYWCTYGSTTYNQITQALAAGKLPVLIDSFNIYYVYTRNDANLHQFKAFRTNVIMRTCRVNASNGWTTADTTMQTTGNLVTSISASSDDSHYPSAKCVYNAIQSAGGHSTTYYAQNQSVSTGNNVTVTAPNYYAYGQYFVDITGYIYSNPRTTRVYLKPTNSTMDVFYGEAVDTDMDSGGLYMKFAVMLEKVSSTSYTFRCVDSQQEYSFLDVMKKTNYYNSSHTLTNFGLII